MISVVETIMGEVVAGRRSDRRDKVKVVKLGDRCQVTLLDKHVHHLSDISPVQIVVICHITPIALVDLS